MNDALAAAELDLRLADVEVQNCQYEVREAESALRDAEADFRAVARRVSELKSAAGVLTPEELEAVGVGMSAKRLDEIERRNEEERARRLSFHGGWHYWSAAGRDRPTLPEHWCDYCAGWFVVSHEYSHDDPPCRHRYREHLCACIDCWVFQNRVDTPSERTEAEA